MENYVQKREMAQLLTKNWANRLVSRTRHVVKNQNTIKINVFPNPSNGALTINAPAIFGHQTIWIYYADGRVVKEISHNFERTESLELNLTHLPKGLFFLLMRNAKGESTLHSKFILQ